MKTKLSCIIIIVSLLLGCLGCAPAARGDYTYEESDVTRGKFYIRSRFSFYYLQQMYQAAGQGADALAAYVQEVDAYYDRISQEISGKVSPTDARNLFLSRYFYSAKDVILVPDQKNAILDEIVFFGPRTDSLKADIWIKYADAVHEYGWKMLIHYVSQSPSDPLAQVRENPAMQAYGEPYAGDGFEAQAYYDRENEWYNIWITDAQGNTLGYIDKISAAEWVETTMTYLSYLKTQTLEQAVKKAKAPGRYDYDREYEVTYPGADWRLNASAFEIVRELYVASGKGEEAYRACAAQNKEGNYLPRRRDEFLTAYYDLADRTVLVPTGKAASLTRVNICDGGWRWQGMTQTCDLWLTYQMANGESWELAVDPTDERTQMYIQGDYTPVSEVYRGNGFTAQLVRYGSHEKASYLILWWNAQGELMGHISETLEKAEAIMELLKDFKAVTFHHAVQRAR